MARSTARGRVVLALLIALGFYALSDILLWQRIFEAHGLSVFDPDYQTGHVAVLIGMMAVGAVLLLDSGLWALWFQGALYTLAFGGVEDILYYWLDGRPIPAALPWLDRSRLIFVRPLSGDVTNLEVLASAAFWVAVWLSLLLVLPRLPASREKLKALLAAGTAAGRRVSARCAARNGGAARSNFQRSLPGRPRSPASPSAPP